jgi:toxin YoeB
METVIAHPSDKEQLAALKAFVKVLKVGFKVEKDTYDLAFVAKIEKSRQEIKEGKGVKNKRRRSVEIIFSERALLDLEKWRKSGNKKAQRKITDLTNAILVSPFRGIGKPEPLKHPLTGLWSRHITHEDRLIYEVGGQIIIVRPLREHYIDLKPL